MTWDVPVKEDCPVCGQTMFKRSGRGYNKPYCINEKCSAFVPEDKRGYRKKTVSEGQTTQAQVNAAEAQPETKAEDTAKPKTMGKAVKDSEKTTEAAAERKRRLKRPGPGQRKL
jgi:DNA topoisomerase-1